jgi:hypothetical protein
MDLNEQGQRFSFAYVRAVASVAGYGVNESETDDDSVDLTIAQRGGGGTVRSPKLDLQVKHKRTVAPLADLIPYPLPVKNYQELRGNDFQVPRILVVVLVPDNVSTWLSLSARSLSSLTRQA